MEKCLSRQNYLLEYLPRPRMQSACQQFSHQSAFRHMASEKSNVDSKVPFKMNDDVNQIAGKLNLQIHNFTDVNQPNLDNLIRNNKDIKEDIRNHRIRSQSLWSKVSGGNTLLQQIIVWVMLVILSIRAIIMLICHTKLRLQIRINGRTKEEEECRQPDKRHEVQDHRSGGRTSGLQIQNTIKRNERGNAKRTVRLILRIQYKQMVIFLHHRHEKCMKIYIYLCTILYYY